MTDPRDDLRTPALGGERTVPAPDAVAADYVLLALRLGQRIEGLVDGYFGPADIKDLLGISRKYAIPLLEYFDGRRVTQRVGERRVLRGT